VEIYFSNRWYAAEFRSAKRYMSEYVLQAWQFHCLEDDDFTIVQVMADLYDENARTPLIRITDPAIMCEIIRTIVPRWEAAEEVQPYKTTPRHS